MARKIYVLDSEPEGGFLSQDYLTFARDEPAFTAAMRRVEKFDEGQVRVSRGGDVIGYAIKYRGQPAYVERCED